MATFLWNLIRLEMFSVFVVLNFLANLPKINFLVIGNINKNPKMSVANPGIIKSNAAKAI